MVFLLQRRTVDYALTYCLFINYINHRLVALALMENFDIKKA